MLEARVKKARRLLDLQRDLQRLEEEENCRPAPQAG